MPPPRPALAGLLVLVVGLVGAGVWGGCEGRRADRAEASLAEARETVSRRDAELDGCEADAAALGDAIDDQNEAVDALREEADRRAGRVAAAEAAARVLREAGRARVGRVLAAPAPATCAGAVALLRDSAVHLARWE